MKTIYTPVKKKTILIVDDDHVVIQVYREKFQAQGFKVEAVNAADAIRKLKKEPVDLVLLDLCLPELDGVEILKSIRSEFTSEVLPIIVFSNPFLGRIGRAALAAGANKCVTKADNTPEELLTLVRELLVLTNSSRTIPTSSESDLRETLAASFLIKAPETLAMLRRRLQILAKPGPADLCQIELSAMHRLARSLAGSAGLLGFTKIAQMSNGLEALLIELHGKPDKITPSTNRTVAQAIDTLGSLLDTTKLQPEGLASPRILVVDDETVSRETICSALGKANLHAVGLEDSIAAEVILKETHFDLIFLDVEMPGQSGLDLCVKIREMATNGATPVVFVTAHSDFGKRAQSTLSGGDDFIAKPFLSVELALKTLTWLSKETVAPLHACSDDAQEQEISEAEPNQHFDKESNQNEAIFLSRS